MSLSTENSWGSTLPNAPQWTREPFLGACDSPLFNYSYFLNDGCQNLLLFRSGIQVSSASATFFYWKERLFEYLQQKTWRKCWRLFSIIEKWIEILSISQICVFTISRENLVTRKLLSKQMPCVFTTWLQGEIARN